MRKRLKDSNEKSFIVVDEYLQAFSGLKGGQPQYDLDWNKAKPLSNDSQFHTLQRMSLLKLEMIDWD